MSRKLFLNVLFLKKKNNPTLGKDENNQSQASKSHSFYLASKQHTRGTFITK